MSDFSSIRSCRDINDDHIAGALETREDTRALLAHAAAIARPRQAGARVLLVFAKMATACDWLDGALRVVVRGDGERSVIESFVEIGAGLKERVFPPMNIEVPLEEFVAAIERFPQAIKPLMLERPSPDRLLLAAREGEARKPPSVRPPKRGARLLTPSPMTHLPLVTLGDEAKPTGHHLPTIAATVPVAMANLPAVGSRDVEASTRDPEENVLPLIEEPPSSRRNDPRADPDDASDAKPSPPAPARPLARIKLKRTMAAIGPAMREVPPPPATLLDASPVPQPPPRAPEQEGKPSEDDVDEGWK